MMTRSPIAPAHPQQRAVAASLDAVLLQVCGYVCLVSTVQIRTIVPWETPTPPLATLDTASEEKFKAAICVGRLQDRTPVFSLGALLYRYAESGVETESAPEPQETSDFNARVLLTTSEIGGITALLGLAVDHIIEVKRIPLSELYPVPHMLVPRRERPITWAFWQPRDEPNHAPIPLVNICAAFAHVDVSEFFEDEVEE